MIESTDDLENIFEQAVKEAETRKHEYVTIEHLLLALVKDKEIGTILVAEQKLRPNQADKILKSYCENLNQKYFDKKIDPVIGREDELEVLKQIMARRNKSNVLIVGDPGVGKTAIVEGLARRIAKNKGRYTRLFKRPYCVQSGHQQYVGRIQIPRRF
jgi:ATP-dependent Clp protease ATP-binding subunit ClpA